MSTIISVFVFSFKSMFRNFKSAGIMFAIPILFMGVFGIAFGGEGNSLDINVGVLENSASDQVGLVKTFEEITEESDSLEINITHYSDQSELEEGVKDKAIDLGLITTISEENNAPQFEIFTLDSNLNSSIYKSVVNDIITPISLQGNNPVTSTILSSAGGSISGFDILAPGLIIYGLIILIPGVADQFVGIEERKQILRYSNSRIKGYELIMGGVLYYLVIGVVQIFLLYFTALLFGYQSTGNLFVAIVPAMLALLFAISCGIFISSFSSKTEAATNLGTIISIILGFFSGSFISGIGRALEFKIAGYELQFNYILPTKWGTEALQKVLTNNQGLADIQLELWILLISGIITLLISILIYSNKKLKFASA